MEKFEKFLKLKNLSFNTIKSYMLYVTDYFKFFDTINKSNLNAYKGYLVEHYKPKTINLHLQALNTYLEYISKINLKYTFIKIPKKSFLENVISTADYTFFKNKLKSESNYTWYFIVRYLGATGARVSELVQIKVEHIYNGYIDLYAKGGKIRRIYIPKRLTKETITWLDERNQVSGYIFLNKYGKQITTRGVAHQLKLLAKKYRMNEKVVYPHSFRHMFAKSFLEKYKDIALLADLMGHENIETTRIYLRRTSEEQHAIVNKVVDW